MSGETPAVRWAPAELSQGLSRLESGEPDVREQFLYRRKINEILADVAAYKTHTKQNPTHVLYTSSPFIGKIQQ